MLSYPYLRIPSIRPLISNFDVLVIALGQMCDEATIPH